MSAGRLVLILGCYAESYASCQLGVPVDYQKEVLRIGPEHPEALLWEIDRIIGDEQRQKALRENIQINLFCSTSPKTWVPSSNLTLFADLIILADEELGILKNRDGLVSLPPQ